jgi:uncharacterized protein
VQTNITHDTATSRYEIAADGTVVGFAEYSVDGDRVTMPHTVIDGSFRGKGLAAQLVRHALDDVRARGLSVVPACSYVRQFIDDNPEYADLVSSR